MKTTAGFLVLFFFIFIIHYTVSAQMTTSDYAARLENDILTLENSKILRSYKWNNGNLVTFSLKNQENGKIWQMNPNKPDLIFPGQTDKATNPHFSSKNIPETAIAPEHLEAEITYTLDKLEVKRVFRIYHDCPAIACDLYFRGASMNIWLKPGQNLADIAYFERLSGNSLGNNAPVSENLELPGKHWKIEAIEFTDVTDQFNNLVHIESAISYRPNIYRGNLLFATDILSGNGILILKECPVSNAQLSYPGGDFFAEFGVFKTIGIGIGSTDLDPDEWRKGYGFVTGVYEGDEAAKLTALREYQKKVRIHKPGRDEMILMNTWGDRGQDTRIRKEFALSELEKGTKLGITHFQLDDGWQTGVSSNSAFKGGTLNNIWDRTNYWEPDPKKFPEGLNPVTKRGKELGIEVCLWFNPSSDNSNENWEKDADVLIGINKKYGIRTFKIDGVKLPDKKAEINFRKFLDKVSKETDYNVVFNLDVTAGRRGGYHYFNEYGNLFLENRYTDFQSYYPYKTLRNLWMLSKYVPPQNLQIEFLNKWRNTDKYRGDPFGPENYSFEYLFATTMAAQPLAWFESTGLPEEAFSIAPVIKKYREIQADLHSGNIFPIGEEPSGKSWSGFQSVQKNKGYLIIFREATDEQEHSLNTWLSEGTMIDCTPVSGTGKAFSARAGKEGSISFSLQEKNSYVLYKYTLK